MSHAHTHKYQSSRGRLFGTILLNIGITAAEFIGGILTGYLALIADAIHNLSDVAALILAYLGELGSQKPATKRSTYGFLRLEVMTAFTSAVALVVIAIYIFYEAYLRFIEPTEIKNPTLLLTVAVIGLIGNILSVFLLHPAKGKSLNIKTAFLHMLFDTLSSAAVIIGAIIILKSGYVFIDPILSIIIGIMILWSSYGVLKEATLIFLEAAPVGIDYDKVEAEIKNHPQVYAVHDLHIWSLSSTERALSCHICIDIADYEKAPEIIHNISSSLHDKFNIGHATIQPEREDCANADLLNHLRRDKP